MALLYKYRSIDEWTRRIVVDGEIYFASPYSFNDPFDCQLNLLETVDHELLRPLMREASAKRSIRVSRAIVGNGTHEPYEGLDPADSIRLMITNAVDNDRMLYSTFEESIQRIRDYVKGLGVLCMSREQCNILMFSHYANCHRGIALGFDEERLSKSFGSPTDVVYSEKMPEVSVLNPLNLFFVKADAWSYEREVRLLARSPGPKSLPRLCLKTIILGCEATPADKQTVGQWILASGQRIRLLQARKVRRDFRLRVVRYEDGAPDASKALYLPK